jgi:hypothetical protein
MAAWPGDENEKEAVHGCGPGGCLRFRNCRSAGCGEPSALQSGRLQGQSLDDVHLPAGDQDCRQAGGLRQLGARLQPALAAAL